MTDSSNQNNEPKQKGNPTNVEGDAASSPPLLLEHEYTNNGFCKHCGWEKGWLEKRQMACQPAQKYTDELSKTNMADVTIPTSPPAQSEMTEQPIMHAPSKDCGLTRKLGFVGWSFSGGAFFGQVPGANLGGIGAAFIGAGAIPAFRAMNTGNANAPMLFVVCLALGVVFLGCGYGQYCSACDAKNKRSETALPTDGGTSVPLSASDGNKHKANLSLVKIVWAIIGGVLFLSLIAFLCVESNRQDVLATAIDGYIGRTLPSLSHLSNLPANVPVGNNAVWWIGEGVEFAGGGTKRATGTMRSSWGGGTIGLAPRFEELDSLFIVKGTLGEEKQYLRVPAGMSPAPTFGFNPFIQPGASPSSFIDRYGKIHSADEFKVTLRTYGLEVWIVDVKSNRIVGYRDFPAAPLLDKYDQDHTADEVHLSALVAWIESLEKLERKPKP